MRTLQKTSIVAILVIGLSATGCASTGARLETSSVGFRTNPATVAGSRILSRHDLDHVIDSRLSRQETVTYLKSIAIEDYSIQDPNTNWSHSSIGNADSIYSLYYLTYRQRYFIFLLVSAWRPVLRLSRCCHRANRLVSL